MCANKKVGRKIPWVGLGNSHHFESQFIQVTSLYMPSATQREIEWEDI